MMDANQSDKKHYGFSPFGYLFWGGSLIVIGGGVIAVNVFLTDLMLPQAGVGVIVLSPLWVMSAIPVVQLFNLCTPVTVGSEGLWIRMFPNVRKFIAWEDVERIYASLGYDIVYVRCYVSPFHWFLGAFSQQSFCLVFGLDLKDELESEIIRRASKAQGKEIPLDFGTSRLF